MVVSASQPARTSRVLTDRKMPEVCGPGGQGRVGVVRDGDREREVLVALDDAAVAGAIEMVALPASAAAGSATWLVAADAVDAEA